MMHIVRILSHPLSPLRRLSLLRPPPIRLAARAMSAAPRSYADAVDHLNSLQSNAATLDAVRASGGRLSDFAIPEMLEYLNRIGYSVSLVQPER